MLFATTSRFGLGPVSVLLPDLATLRLAPAAIALGAGWLLLRRHWPLPQVLGLAAVSSALLSLV